MEVSLVKTPTMGGLKIPTISRSKTPTISRLKKPTMGRLKKPTKSVLKKPTMGRKLNYIHLNPLQQHWNLVTDPNDYVFSSCSFYERNDHRYSWLRDYREDF